MKKDLITFLAIIALLICMGKASAQTKKSSDTSFFSNLTPTFYKPPENYTYLFINGKVKFYAKNGWLITVKDTTKFCIKYQDSIFVIHISHKFAKKINDSTYTFQNK